MEKVFEYNHSAIRLRGHVVVNGKTFEVLNSTSYNINWIHSKVKIEIRNLFPTNYLTELTLFITISALQYMQCTCIII